jgi:tetratricopeptide (TPR) repeat protein
MVTTLRHLCAAFIAALLACGCTPQQALVGALMPASALTTLLGNMGRVSDDSLKRVVELERKGDWDELARFAEQNITRDRSNAEWWLIAGYARSQLGRHASAAQAYDMVVRLEPDNAAGWNMLAQSYRANGELNRAVNTLNNALLALRDPAATHFLLGEAYMDLGRSQDAAAAYREAVKIEAGFGAAWFGLARAYERAGRTAEARDAESQLEKLDPAQARRLRESRSGDTRER